MRKVRKPDFLGIGAQKAATRWLYKQLKQHPDIYLTPVKELHYFDVLRNTDNYFDRFDKRVWKVNYKKLVSGKRRSNILWHMKYLFMPYSDQWYYSLFLDSKGRKSGEITPRYSEISLKNIHDIRSLNKEIRLLYFLRDPVGRAWSHFRMTLGWSGRDYDELSEKEVFSFLESESCTQRGNYYDNLIKWYKVFPERQFCIGYLEEVKENPSELLKRVLGHLDVSDDTLMLGKSINKPTHVGQPIPMESRYEEYLQEKYYSQNKKLFELLGNPIVKGWYE